MTAPLISCIVPVFNGEHYLKETLDSILAQSYRPLDIIIIDDGSTDRTAEVARPYGQLVRYFRQPNAGEAAARDRGAALARGDYVAFLDADDLWHPDKLTRQMTRIGERREIDILFTHFKNFWIPELIDERVSPHGEALDQVQTGWIISTFLAARAVFDKFGTFVDHRAPAPSSQSMTWYLRAVRMGAIIDMLPQPLMFRRLHDTNQSRTNTVDALFPILKEWRAYQHWRKNR